MALVHTLLFMLRENTMERDIQLAAACLKSLEKSAYRKVIVYNQGFWCNERLEEFLEQFALETTVIGAGENVGTVVGRQSCFQYIYQTLPDTAYISELHLDMVFVEKWELPLIAYLETHNEPVISCGIVDENGVLCYLDAAPVPLPPNGADWEAFLQGLRREVTVPGFTNPCIHKMEILKSTSGYDGRFLKGKHAFEDDSMLLGYYYYYGTKANWQPLVYYGSVVYHKVAGQRSTLGENVMQNYDGLLKQYGAMGIGHLSKMKRTDWQNNFFGSRFSELTGE